MATTNKYDRQLRLWGASGQKALHETCVVLVGASAAGTETLKNLVLPGIGSFVVIDNDSDESSSYASNFFLPKNDEIGNSDAKSKAEVAMQHLQELNPDVHGAFKNAVPNLDGADFGALLEEVVPSECNKSLLVIGSDLIPPTLDRLAFACQQRSCPLVVVQSYGWFGCVKVQSSSPLPIMKPRPRDSPPDLRLVKPLDSVQKMLMELPDWSDMDGQQHSHIPYPLILLKASDKWKSEHDGNLPKTFNEKQEFANLIQSMSRDYNKELNFQEAKQNAYLAYAERTIDTDHLNMLLEATNPATTAGSLTCSCSKMHSLLVALQQFMSKHDGRTPVQGNLPDMTSSTESYVQLQHAYKQQAEADIAEIKSLLSLPRDDDEMITTFCQNVFNLDLYQPRTLQQQYDLSEKVPDEIAEDLGMSTMEGDERPDQLPLLWYLGLMACRLFYLKDGNNRYPGCTKDWESDVTPLQACIIDVVHRYKLQKNETVKATLLAPSHNYAHELCRCANSELHNIASVVGGVASQEAVKVITGQYIPFDNTYVYNGIASTGGVYKF